MFSCLLLRYALLRWPLVKTKTISASLPGERRKEGYGSDEGTALKMSSDQSLF